jgi:hypothetical protein
MPCGQAPFCDAPTMATDLARKRLPTGLAVKVVMGHPFVLRLFFPIAQTKRDCKVRSSSQQLVARAQAHGGKSALYESCSMLETDD